VIVDEFEKDRVALCRVQNEAAEEESGLVDQLEVIDVEKKAAIARLDAKRKELLRQLKEERRGVLSELKKRRKKLSSKIRDARKRQACAINKIQHLREIRDRRISKLKTSKRRLSDEDDSDEDQSQNDDQDDDESDEESVDEEWQRLTTSFKNIARDGEVKIARHKAMNEAFRELVELKVVAPPSYENSHAPEPALKTLDDLLAAIRNDNVAQVSEYGPALLETSVVEEQVARDDSTHEGVLRLPGVRALIAALTSPDCSWRTLKLLVAWARASGPHASIYNVCEMERYWLAGFKGLQWFDSVSSTSTQINAHVSALLPQSYTPKNRMGKKTVRDWELDVLVPIIDIDSDSAEDSVEDTLHKVFQAPILNEGIRRLVNQASKLFAVCRGELVSGVYHLVLATSERSVGWDLEERRGRFGRKNVELTSAEADTARRVVRACWRLE